MSATQLHVNVTENTPLVPEDGRARQRASSSWDVDAHSEAVNRWGLRILTALALVTCMRTPQTQKFSIRWWCSLFGPLLFTGVLLIPLTFTGELDASGCLNLATTVGMLLASVWGLFFTVPSLNGIYNRCTVNIDESRHPGTDRSTSLHLLGGGCVFLAFSVIYGLLFGGWVDQVSAHFPGARPFITVAARVDGVVLMCWTTTFLMAVSRVCSMIGLEMESCAACLTAWKDKVTMVADEWDRQQIRRAAHAQDAASGNNNSAPWNDAAAARAELGLQHDKLDLLVLNGPKLVEFIGQHAKQVQRIRANIRAFSTSVGPFLTIALFFHGLDLLAFTWAFLISNFFALEPEYQYWIGAGHDALCMMLTIWPVAWICKTARIIGSEADELATAIQRLNRPDLSAALAPQVATARSFATNTFVTLGGFAITPALLGTLTIFLCSSAASLLNYMHQHQ